MSGLLLVEADVTKYGIYERKDKIPGPGQYDPHNEDLATINYNTTSIEGSFPKAARLNTKPLGSSPGPIYSTSKAHKLVKPKPHGGSFGKSKRFPDIPETPGFYAKDRRPKPVSTEGTFSHADRGSYLTGTVSPGPCYDTRRPLVKGRNSAMPKAERFPTSEEDSSPGPIYLPTTPPHGPVAKVSYGKRFMEPPHPGPGPGSAVPEVDKAVAKAPPAYSIVGKPKDERPSGVPGAIYHPLDDKYKTPAFSFAGPDPNQVAGPKGAQVGSPKKTRAQQASGELRDGGPNAPEGPDDAGEGDGAPAEKGKAGPKANSPRRAKSPKATSPSQHRTLSPIKANTGPTGHETPGPGHYLNTNKMFENRPSARAPSMGRRLPQPPNGTPGPGSYAVPVVVGRKDTPGMKFGSAKRDPPGSGSQSPGPIYNNEKWTVKTPIRHGVASQTTNYTAKAEARARAERDAKEQSQMRKQMQALQGDVLPCDEEFYDYTPTRLDDVTTTTKDRFLMNVWY